METKNFLFSSVGDNTDFDTLWFDDNMNYDIYVIYYGNNEENYKKYKSKVTFIESRKGAKYQNFKYFYDTYPNIIEKYDRFFLLDDDIIINVEDINEMFKISREYDLEICGPSFTDEGKISHGITRHKPNILLSYTSFVENNVPLFSKEALDKLMDKIDNTLFGWGIDFLYIICNGLNKKKSYAIIHKIKCVNPFDKNKKKKNREWNNIEGVNKEQKNWIEFSKINNILNTFPREVYDSINDDNFDK